MSELKKTVKGVLVIIVGIFLGKIVSLLRMSVVGSYFGVSHINDIYNTALLIDSVILSSLAFAISITFIPIFNSLVVKKGKEEAFKTANNVMNIMVLGSIVVIITAYFFRRPIVRLAGSGYKGEDYEMAIKLTVMMLPVVIFTMLCSLYNSILQCFGKFAVPALVLVPYNIIIIAVLILTPAKYRIYGYVIGTVLGYASQVVFQIPSARKLGYRYKFFINFKDPAIKVLFITAIPVIIGGQIQNINTFVDKSVASSIVTGAVSALDYGNRVNNLVLSIFITAIVKVIFPSMSRVIAEGNKAELEKIFKVSTNVVIIITMPIMFIVLSMNNDIIKLLLQSGNFKERAVQMSSTALFCYAIGLIGMCLREIISRCFYSLNDTKTPMINGIIGVAINLVLIGFFVKVLDIGYGGLALATSIAANVVYILLAYSFKKKVGDFDFKSILMTFIKTFFAGAAMAGVIKLILPIILTFNTLVKHSGLFAQKIGYIINLSLAAGCGLIVYIGICFILKLPEFTYIKNMAALRLKKARGV